MILYTIDNVLNNPEEYVDAILSGEFNDVPDGDKVFKNIQPRLHHDEFAKFISNAFLKYDISYNFVRKSPLGQVEPNFIHKDDMMGDMTCILYLNKTHPKEDGTTIYDDDNNAVCKIHAKFNRMIAFNSKLSHSRNIFENFGEGEDARLIQVIFLKNKNDKQRD